MIDIKKVLNGGKKRVIPVIIIFLLAVGIITTIVHRSLSKSQKTIGNTQNPVLLIQRMDKLMESVKKQKSVVNTLDQKEEIHEVSAMDEVSLNGIIIWNTQKPLAFVNGQVVRLNDNVAGFRIIDIEDGSITLIDKQGEEKVVYLYE